MRKLPAGIAISAVAHAAAVAWVGTHPADGPRARAPRAPIVELIEIEAAPAPPPAVASPAVNLALFDERTTAAVPELGAPPPREPREPRDPPRTSRPELRARATAHALPETSEPGTAADLGEPPSSPTRAPLFDMRKGKPARLALGLPTGRWDGRAAPRETYGPEIDAGQLAPAGGGTFSSNQGAFTARVERDGSVTLKDARNFNVRLALPGRKQIGDAIASWYHDPNKPVGTLGPLPEATPRLNLGESSSEDRKPDHGKTVPIISGGFDISDALMRRKGQDPYASKKLAFLDATRDQRVQLGQRHRQQQLEQAPEIMRKNLARLWATVTEPAARRAALFELWDECAETGAAPLVDAGRQARALVIGFVRAKLPAGSATAYTPAELAALNARRQSSATFAPYEDGAR